MTSLCLYFQVHQPHRLKRYTYFDVGNNHFYYDDEKNRNILLKVSHKCYLPTNQLLLDLIKKHQGKFKVAFSLSGTVIEQLKKFSPETLDSFKRLAETSCVEFLSETYHHSLSFIFSKDEFKAQVKTHQKLVENEFSCRPTTFRNTELIYNDDLAHFVGDMGYKTILAEGAEHVLGWQSPNYVYRPLGKEMTLLLKNYKLSDDVAFRFSENNWKEFPLTADKYACWVHTHYHQDIVNLFMDYETFGEHQWESTGIFNFLSHLPDKIFQHPEFDFVTPSEASERYSPVAELSFPHFVSWADVDRDLTAWCGNALQEDALRTVYDLENPVKSLGDEDLIHTWRSMLTSDHFYYMCTKWFNDGDVHAYFNPYDNPYEAYINYQNVISDLRLQIEQRNTR